MNLAKNLVAMMKRERLTFSRLEALTGVSRSTLHGWTTGRRVRDLEDVVRVAEVLKISLIDLMFGARERPGASFRLKVSDFSSWCQSQV